MLSKSAHILELAPKSHLYYGGVDRNPDQKMEGTFSSSSLDIYLHTQSDQGNSISSAGRICFSGTRDSATISNM